MLSVANTEKWIENEQQVVFSFEYMASMFNVLAVRERIKYNYHRAEEFALARNVLSDTQSNFEVVVIEAIMCHLRSSSRISSVRLVQLDLFHLKWLKVAQFIHISRDLSIPFFAFSWFYYLRLLLFLLCCAPFAQLHHAIFDLFLFLLPIQCLMTVYMRAMPRRLPADE